MSCDSDSLTPVRGVIQRGVVMKKLFFVIAILFAQFSFANGDETNRQVKAISTKALWSLDSVDYAVSQGQSSAVCYSLGSVAFAIKELSDRTIKGSMAGGKFITDSTLINMIRTLPYIPTACAGTSVLDESDMRDVRSFKTLMRSRLEEILVHLQ